MKHFYDKEPEGQEGGIPLLKMVLKPSVMSRMDYIAKFDGLMTSGKYYNAFVYAQEHNLPLLKERARRALEGRGYNPQGVKVLDDTDKAW